MKETKNENDTTMKQKFVALWHQKCVFLIQDAQVN